jgi:hypothetical protein
MSHDASSDPQSDQPQDWDRETVDGVWLDSLLHHMHHDDHQANEVRLAALRQRIGGRTSVRQATPRRWRPYVSYLVAASLLIALGIFFSQSVRLGPDSAAMAAVSKSMAASVGYREYRLRILGRRAFGANQESVARLYLDPQDRFVLLHPGWLGLGQTTIGGDRSHRWIVPRIGPVMVGGEELLGKWLAKKEIASPYLHVQTILERMKRAYDLELRSDESLPMLDQEGRPMQDQLFVCQRIHGKRRVRNESLPQEIDLWADRDSGVARRLRLEWESSNAQTLPRRWTLDLCEPDGNQATRSSDWYQYSAHVDSNRRVISVGSQRDLDAINVPKHEGDRE